MFQSPVISKVIKPTPKSGPYSTTRMFHVSGRSRWYTCREEFHNEVIRPTSFYYGSEDITSFAAIVDWVENALNLKSEHRLKVHLCSDSKKPKKENKGIICIKVSGFWGENKVRYCFLTALCRTDALRWYHPLDAIKLVSYFNSTKMATGLFLGGHTLIEPGHVFNNWVYSFCKGSKLVERLKKPSTKKECGFFIDETPKCMLTAHEKWDIIDWVKSDEGRNLPNGVQPFWL